MATRVPSAKTPTTDVTTSHAPRVRPPVLVSLRQSARDGFSGNQATLRRLSQTAPHLQCKLQIGAVNDPFEAEADRVADQVMRMSDPAITPTGVPQTLHRKCVACGEEATSIRTKQDGQPQHRV